MNWNQYDMARYSVFRWFCYGCCVLCGFFQQVEAATRVNVNQPAYPAAVAASTSSSIANGVLSLGGVALEGEYIPAATKNVPVRGILGGVEVGLNTIATGAKGIVKGGVAAILAAAAFDQLIKGLDWVMDDGAVSKKTDGALVPVDTTGTNYYWHDYARGVNGNTPENTCKAAVADWGFTASDTQVTMTSSTSYSCDIYLGGSFWRTITGVRNGSSCPTGTSYSSTLSGCASPGVTAPVTDSDLDDITKYINSKQDAAWTKSLLQAMCSGATGGSSPDSCYRDLAAKRKILSGPSSVQGTSTSATTTSQNSDGTTSQATTTESTNYGITYGSDYFDATPVTTTTTSKDGTVTSTTTKTDTSPAESSDDSTDTDNTTASPCTVNCDGPAYTPLYTKTTDTKESALDSYASRVQALPIIAAATGFFTVSAGGGCPVWSVNTEFAVYSVSMPINLVFDYQCQSWFTAVASAAKIVMSIVCAYLAFRQAILD